MAKSKFKTNGHVTRTRPNRPPGITQNESRSSVTVTVAWMLTSLVTAAAVALSLVCRMFAAVEGILLLSDLFLIVAMVAGVLALSLTPVTYQMREIKPPRPIVVATIGIGLLPFALFGIFNCL